MTTVNLAEVKQYVDQEIERFYQARLNAVESMTLAKLMKKNPYLFRTKNPLRPIDLVEDVLNAFLYSSEEKSFGDFLERLVLFIVDRAYGGHKSGTGGVDVEFRKNGIFYIMSVKSGTSWGNSSQQAKQEQNFTTAVTRLKQLDRTMNIQPVLGICYGSTRTSFLRGYMKVVGQSFWHLLTDEQEFYKLLMEWVGQSTLEHQGVFLTARNAKINQLSEEMSRFCDANGYIDWLKLVEFNSGNMK